MSIQRFQTIIPPVFHLFAKTAFRLKIGKAVFSTNGLAMALTEAGGWKPPLHELFIEHKGHVGAACGQAEDVARSRGTEENGCEHGCGDVQ